MNAGFDIPSAICLADAHSPLRHFPRLST
jgi:hypothetical protein